MLQSGDYVRPRFQTEPLYEKPIGIYWLQSAAVACIAARDAIWPYRVPSAVGAILAVLGTLAIGARHSDRTMGLLAAALLAASPLLVVEADLATTDAVLLACVVVSQGCLAEIYFAPVRGAVGGPWPVVGFWTGLGLGILIKGPVAPAVSFLTIAALRFSPQPVRTADLHIRWGLPIIAAIVAPWALAVGIETGWTFYADAFHNDLLPKLIGGQESHGAPPGYYVVLSPAMFWPGSLVALPAAWSAVREREDPWIRFLLAWLMPTWVLFELMPTKLPHYVLPTYPALALLCARAIRATPEVLRSRGSALSLWLWCGVGLLVAAVVLTAPIFLGATISMANFVPALVAVATVMIGKRLRDRGDLLRAMWVAILGSGLMLASTLGVVLPGIDPLWPSVRAARAVDDRSFPAKPPLAVVGYREPSLVFLLGGDVSRLDPGEAARLLATQPSALAWVDDAQRTAFESASTREDVKVNEVAAVDGWNISKGRRLRLHLFERVH
jgi:4-amino-4-deoxy-L-arabinose transferase-like glycosyltransferase